MRNKEEASEGKKRMESRLCDDERRKKLVNSVNLYALYGLFHRKENWMKKPRRQLTEMVSFIGSEPIFLLYCRNLVKYSDVPRRKVNLHIWNES